MMDFSGLESRLKEMGSKEYSLKDFLEKIGFELSGDIIPALSLSIQSYQRNNDDQEMGILCKSGENEAGLVFTFGENTRMLFTFSSKNPEGILFQSFSGFLIDGGFPSDFCQKIKNAHLNEFEISFETGRQEFFLLAEGAIFQIPGRIIFQTFKNGGSQIFIISFYCSAEPVLLTDLLEKQLGLAINPGLKQILPAFGFAVREFSINQLEKSLVMSGVVQKPGLYEIECYASLTWNQNLEIVLRLTAEKAPPTLQSLSQDLPISLNQIKDMGYIPEKVLNKIGATELHSLSFELDGNSRSVKLDGAVKLFGSLTSLTVITFNFEPQEFAFDAHIYGEPLSLKELFETFGMEIDLSLPDIKLLLSEIHLSTKGEFKIMAGVTFDAKNQLGLVSFSQVELTIKPKMGYLKLQCLSKSDISIAIGSVPLIVSSGILFEMENYKVKQALITGEFNYQFINFNLRMDIHSEGSGTMGSQFLANASNVGLAEISEKILQTKLPDGLPDLVLDQLELAIGTDQSVSLNGKVSIIKDQKLKLLELEAPFASLEFGFLKNITETKASIIARGNQFPEFETLNMELKEFAFEFKYAKQQSETSGSWFIGGSLGVSAFERLILFKAAAQKNKDIQSIDFTATAEPVIIKGFFSGIRGLDSEALMAKLRENKYLNENNILDSKLDIHSINLGDQFQTVLEPIKAVLTQVQKNNRPLITLPDLLKLSANEQIGSVNPVSLAIHIQREKGKTEWKLAAVTDFQLFDFCQKGQTILTVEKGVFSAFHENGQTGFQFEANHESNHNELYPLRLIPGLPDMLHQAFGEPDASGTKKTDAFLNLFLLELGALRFTHDNLNGWSVQGALIMKLTDGLKTVHQDLYDILDRLFPKGTGSERQIEGAISISSQKGLVFELTNNSGLEIPNLLKTVSEGIPRKIRQEIQERFQAIGVQLDADNLLDVGAAYFLLEKFKFTINKEADFKVTLAAGLPAKLNDYIFSKTSKLYGILKTYAREKLGNRKADQKPDDNLLRASLTIGTKGVSGELENFDLIDKEKLKQVAGDFIASCYEEKDDSITFDFDGLVDGKIPADEHQRKYGKVKFDKPKFNLDLSSGSFQASGGIHVESEQLKIPVRPVIKKLLALLPLEQYHLKSIANLADLLTDGVPIRSITFFKDGKLNLSDLELWLQELIHEDLRDQFRIPQVFKDIIEKEGGRFANGLPQPFKDYLSIVLPKGFKFNIIVPPDQTFSFQFEVDQTGPGTHELKDYLQLLIPDPSNPFYIYGLRLRKIGLGTALFNQFLRLDLSAEVDIFNTIHLAAGLLLEDKTQETGELKKLLLPDKNKFCLHLEARNLLTLIIWQTVFPIPVPLFYDRLYASYFGLEGVETEFDIGFSAPQFNVQKIIKRFGDLKNFFTVKDDSLPVPSHALAKLEGGMAAGKDIIPSFNAGPFYFRFPGYLGYEITSDSGTGAEVKRLITLGFTKQMAVDFMDLIGVSANALKFSIYPLFDPEVEPKVPVKSAKDPAKIVARVTPFNYMIQYIPLEDRVGVKKIKLFYLFDIDFAWALTTPQEFIQTAYPKLKAKYELQSATGSRYVAIKKESTAAELLELFNQNDTGREISETDDGVVFFLRGGLKITDSFILETALGLAAGGPAGFRTGISFYGFLADIIETKLLGFIKIAPESEETFKLLGKASLAIFNHEILKGLFELTNEHLTIAGQLDLFPTGWPLTLKGFIAGHIAEKEFYLKSDAIFELGALKALSHLLIHAKPGLNLFQLNLFFLNSTLDIDFQQLSQRDGGSFALDVHLNAMQLLDFTSQLRVVYGLETGIIFNGHSLLSIGYSNWLIVRIETYLRGAFNPAAGFLGFSAELAPNSYLLGPDCRISGGFAFYSWFTTGDFVLTVGGYHPQFQPPLHYPMVPRVGLHWQIDSHTSITGTGYFALTPSCVMAGGDLSLVFQLGDLKAWFTASANFIAQWKPLYYSAQIRVSIGVSYRLNFLLFSVTVGASLDAELEIWGPPTGGRVHIDWDIISFTIGFGAPKALALDPLSWDDFVAMLPQQKAIPRITALSGITGQTGDGGWITSASELEFKIEAMLPVNKLIVNTGTGIDTELIKAKDYQLDICPMGKKGLDSELILKIEKERTATEKDPVDLINAKWRLAEELQNLPEALWGAPLPEGEPLQPSARILPQRLVGFKVAAPQSDLGNIQGIIDVPENMSYTPIEPGGIMPSFDEQPDIPITPKTDPDSIPRNSQTSGTGKQNHDDIYRTLNGLGAAPPIKNSPI